MFAFEVGDRVQLTEDSYMFYEESERYRDTDYNDLEWTTLTVIEKIVLEDGTFLLTVEDEEGRTFAFYDFELEAAK